ncbi:ras guanine nucleotide exchange factor domain-containing protein [Sporodiniella umbellata]|nr:ras guanine nucleotide exchange factor domain-containing protein [Sporodiniella umbellata]
MSTLAPKIIGRVRAVYSYDSDERSSLSFKRGDYIDVLAKLESGWWDGWCNGERGWFPSNYVETAPETPRALDPPRSSLDSSSTGSASSSVNLRDGGSVQITNNRNPYDEDHNGETIDQNSVLASEESIVCGSLQEEYSVPTLEQLMENWVERKTPQGRLYFCNLITQETTWDADEIDTDTGCLRKSENILKDPLPQAITPPEETKHISWGKTATDVAFHIHELITAVQNGSRDQVQARTSLIVESIRLMLYASGALERDSPLVHEPVFRDPRRAILSSLSKLVLDSKLSVELTHASAGMVLEKLQKDAQDVMKGTRDYITACQQRNVALLDINPQLVKDVSELPFDAATLASAEMQTVNNPTLRASLSATGMASLGLTANDRKKLNQVTTETHHSMLQRAKYMLNQDLILSLQVYSHQIYTSAEELSAAAHAILTEFERDNTHHYETERSASVSFFRTLSTQIGQYLAILDDINLDGIDTQQIPSIATYQISRKGIYGAVGYMFGAVQTLTDVSRDLKESTYGVKDAVHHVESVIETVEQSVIAMVNERKRRMGVHSEDKNLLLCDEPKDITAREDNVNREALPRQSTLPGISDIVNRRRQESIRPEDRSADTLGSDHQPDEVELGPDGAIRGGTLPALVERLTVHDTLDTNFIATFLLTYRSFCTTEDVVSLLESRYNLRPPERLTPEQLEMWTERKQKLVRLRIFNVMKTWLENYYIDEDEHLLPRFEYFTNAYIRDSSEFAANQILTLIKKRTESRGVLKKTVQNPISGPDPIVPKNIQAITLLDTDTIEMARQLSIMDFKLYSSIRPIECLGKAWSKEGDRGSVAIHIKKSIQYCNRLTSWVTQSILSYEEPKKRATVIKYWVQVANHCRVLSNYNTCMAILSAFDNSSIGRLKKTWMICSRNTTQALASIRKLLGANRNFTEYRDIVHSVNPPCIPFLGIYLQDLTFIEDGNPDYLRKSNHLINFAKRQKVAEVIRELKQFQSFAYNFHTIPEFQHFIETQLSYEHDVERLYERSLQLEPRNQESSTTATNHLI